VIRPELRVLRGWGEVHQGRSLVYHPRTPEEAAESLADAARRGLTVAHRGSGLSYGDLALNEGGAVVETGGLTGVLELDREGGVVRARAGTTIEELWHDTLPLGWWPPVVPGTMHVTLGGAIAVNAHGKNHVAAGAIGEHVQSVTVLDARGEVRTLTAATDRTALNDVIGGLGLGGTILEVTLQLHRLHSGLLEVETSATTDLAATLDALEQAAERWTHTVAWLDGNAGRHTGRGVLSCGRDLAPDHPRAGVALTVAEQRRERRLIGGAVRRFGPTGLRVLLNDPGLRALNFGRYVAARARSGRLTLEPHARFHFLLDRVPGWKRAYLPHGLVQYQMFVPRAAARRAFVEALRLRADADVPVALVVAKRHRDDPFPASYAMDGFSLALDFPVRPAGLDRLVRLFRSYDALVAEVGGRIYAAKDGMSLGRLPAVRDPLFSSNLVRRWQCGEGGS
jgi:decaprenylphospho-beta-D-ribofuranose 2-oxidase